MNSWLFLLPFVSAFAGWLIHKGAAFFIFRKYWPKKKEQLIATIGEQAAFHMPTEDIEAKLASPQTVDKMMPKIESHIDTFLNEKLQKEIPMLGMFITNKTTDKVKEVFMNELRFLFPEVMTGMLKDLKNNFNPQNLIREKLKSDSIQQKMDKSISQQLNKIPMLGLAAGFFIGLINLIIIFLLNGTVF